MQTKKMSAVESVTNTALGMALSMALTYFVFPMFGLSVSVGQAFNITLIFTIVGTLRSYTVRRVFNWIHHRKDDDVSSI